jgi:tRNA (guanine37-N1)-methyltransferase
LIKKYAFISVFPEIFVPFSQFGIVKKASDSGIIQIKSFNPRDFLNNKDRIDDKVYGGGPGMLFKSEPIQKCINHAKDNFSGSSKVIHLSASGETFSAQTARELSKEDSLIFLSSRYEGLDQRVIDAEVDKEISIGDYVLMGGEIPSMVLLEAIIRFIDGVVGDEESVKNDSFENSLLEHPQYTRPEKNELGEVPKTLLSGNHDQIKKWKRKHSLGKTFLRRHDLIKQHDLNQQDIDLIKEFLSDLGYESDRIAELLSIINNEN